MQLPFENVEIAFKKMKACDVSSDDEVIKQGDPAEQFYIIESGRAEVLQQGIYGSEQLKVAVLGAGGHFGEDALIIWWSKKRNSENAWRWTSVGIEKWWFPVADS